MKKQIGDANSVTSQANYHHNFMLQITVK